MTKIGTHSQGEEGRVLKLLDALFSLALRSEKRSFKFLFSFSLLNSFLRAHIF